MAYIGKTPITGNFVKLDAISVVNGQAGYTMNNGGSAFTDYENVNQFLVSLNGILQAPTDSFTVSGSTITFASNLSTGDVIDFIIVLGNTLDIGTPSDATVTQAKTNFVSTSSSAGLQIKGDGSSTDGTLQLNCSQNSHGIKLASPAHSAGQSYTLKFPTGNVTADKILKVASVSGSGTTGIGQLSFADEPTGGKVHQFIVGGNGTTPYQGLGFGTYSSSYQNTVHVTITPSATNSTIEVYGFFKISTGGNAGEYQIYREISGGSSSEVNVFSLPSSTNTGLAYIGAKDTSHSTTSEITYRLRIKNNGVGHYTYLESAGNTSKLALIAVEILA